MPASIRTAAASAVLLVATTGTAEPVERPIEHDSATIVQPAAAMDAGRLTSERLVSAFLARIAAYDQRGPPVNAVITLNPDAMADAPAAGAERRHGRTRWLHHSR
jgi:amidase